MGIRDVNKIYTDHELLYAASAICNCGAGLAYPIAHEEAIRINAWVCSKVLKGAPVLEGKPPAINPILGVSPDEEITRQIQHDIRPFAFWKIREETSINSSPGLTTRPAGTVCRTVGMAHCGACDHKWESEPYEAAGRPHHWFSGPCPKCGNDCGTAGIWSSADKRPRVEHRYRDVVLDVPVTAEATEKNG